MIRRYARHSTRLMGWLSGALVILTFFVLAGLAAGIITFSTYYPRTNPLNLTPLLPQMQGYLAGLGLGVTARHMDTYYDNGNIVLRADDLRVYGADRTLAIVAERLALDLSRSRLFMGIPAPKALRAENVTMRVVRKADGISIAGLNLADTQGSSEGPNLGGMVEWLNSLGLSLRWGALDQASANNVTLLVRDDVQQAEWAMENGQLDFARTHEGEKATLTADLRRLYGGKAIPPMPVLAVFDHASGAENATLRARFDKSDISMVADYFPPQIEKMFKAQGRVELGVLLTEGNKLGQPWVTLRLNDVSMALPAGYSKPLSFPQFNVTATYQPTPTDVLTISSLEATTKAGLEVRGRGTIEGLASSAAVPAGEVSASTPSPTALVSATESTPPELVQTVSSTLMMDLTFAIPEGNVKDLYELAPDLHKPFAKTLAWLKPNILTGRFTNGVAHYHGNPGDFPACGAACGVTVTADIASGGRVRYIDNVAPATMTAPGKFTLAGETIHITAPTATTSSQQGSNVDVAITELFSPEVDTIIRVSTKIAGPLDDLVREVGKIEKPIPLTADGQHSTSLKVVLPLRRGKPTELDDADITADSIFSDVTLSRFDDLKDTQFTASKAQFTLTDETAAMSANGKLNGEPMQISWQDNWRKSNAHQMKLQAEGRLPASWLMANLVKDNKDNLTLTGVTVLKAKLDESGDSMAFNVSGNARETGLDVKPLNWKKPEGQALNFATQGQVSTSGDTLRKLVLTSLNLDGSNVAVNGSLTYLPDNMADTRVSFRQFRLGRTNGSLTWDGHDLALTGAAFDFTAFKNDDKSPSKLPDLNAQLDVQSLLMPRGELRDVKAHLEHRGGAWQLGGITATAEGTPVRITEVPLPGQPGRRRLDFDIADLGRLLSITDFYPNLRKGHLTGQLTYDTPTVAGGVLTLRNFELENPPTLVKLLGLLSLQQLFAGTDTLLFDKAIIPLRLENTAVYLDKMVMEGPALSLRLDGVYYRDAEQLDMNGRLTPALPFNRVVAKIPLIGTLLTGSQDGLVVADFRMKGSSDDPKIEVRPLSVLTPGLLKDIFRSSNETPAKKPKVESNVP